MSNSTLPKILIIDDIPENIRMLGTVLQNDYDVFMATNGEDGLAIANSESPPDLILLDVHMPRMNGFVVCAKLKSEEKTKDIPVIFLTALNEDVNEEKGLLLGAVDYIRKPINLPILQARVHNHIRLKLYTDYLKKLLRQYEDERNKTENDDMPPLFGISIDELKKTMGKI